MTPKRYQAGGLAGALGPAPQAGPVGGPIRPPQDPLNLLTGGGRKNIWQAGGWQNYYNQYYGGNPPTPFTTQTPAPTAAPAPPAPAGQPAGGTPQTPSVPQPAGSSRQINTSINPSPIYPPGFAQSQGNLAAALATPSRTDLMAGRGRPGLSLGSPAIQQGAAIDWGQQMAQAQMARPQVAQQIQMANAQNMLAGQQGREQEALGWGQLAAGQQNYQNQMRQLQQNALLGMLTGQGAWWI